MIYSPPGTGGSRRAKMCITYCAVMRQGKPRYRCEEYTG